MQSMETVKLQHINIWWLHHNFPTHKKYIYLFCWICCSMPKQMICSLSIRLTYCLSHFYTKIQLMITYVTIYIQIITVHWLTIHVHSVHFTHKKCVLDLVVFVLFWMQFFSSNVWKIIELAESMGCQHVSCVSFIIFNLWCFDK